MIRILPFDLPAETAAELAEYQAAVDVLASYEERVVLGKRLFEAKNRKDNPTFRVVRDVLDRMCRGAKRCMYCDDSVAYQVEHFRPKDLYPEFVFAWSNYLYACGPCNEPKNNRFCVTSAATGLTVDVTRPRNALVVAPAQGEPLLINPLYEDPLEFMRLDLQGTFLFKEIHPSGTKGFERAEYTIKVFDLNGVQGRDYLPTARYSAYEAYCGILGRYISDKDAERPQTKLLCKTVAIRRLGHPTVWVEMKRQRHQIRELAEMFARAPEALDW